MPSCQRCRKPLKKKRANEKLIHYQCTGCKRHYVFDLITGRMRRVTV